MSNMKIVTYNPAELRPDDDGILAPGTPQPGEYFEQVVIHPDNLTIRERAEQTRLAHGWGQELTAAQIKALKAQLKLLDNQLADYDHQLAERRQLKERIHTTAQEYKTDLTRYEALRAGAGETYQGETAEIFEHLKRLRAAARNDKTRAQALNLSLKQFYPLSIKRAAIEKQLAAHETAIERAQLLENIKQQLMLEVAEHEERIIKTLSRLTFTQEIRKGNRRFRKNMQIEHSFINSHGIWMKIAVGKRTMGGGWIDLVPHGKKVVDIVNNETVLRELALAVQRQVTGQYTYKNGAWIVVHRLGTTDGILNTINVTPLLDAFDDSMKPDHSNFLGVTSGDMLVDASLEQYPHMLIAGVTGSGKSTFLNSYLVGFIHNYSPAEIRLVMADLKEGIEFSNYEGCPHLLGDVITDPETLDHTLAGLTALMTERMQLFRQHRTRKIAEFNGLMRHMGQPDNQLPRIVFVIDEVQTIHDPSKADRRKNIEAYLWQIMSKGRAAGIHVIICTQYPKNDVLPTNITAQAPLRICLRVNNGTQSRTIIDVSDAAELPFIPGRAIAYGLQQTANPLGETNSGLAKIQAANITTVQLREYVALAAETWGTPPPLELPQVTQAPGLSIDRLIWYSVNVFDYSLSARPMHKDLKDDFNITLREITEIIQEIVKQKTVEHDGVIYEVAPYRRAYKLVVKDKNK